MTTSFKSTAGILILAAMLGLSACSSSNNNAGNDSQEAAPTAEAAATLQPEASSPSAPPSTEPSEVPSAASPSAAGGGAAATSVPQTSVTQDSNKLLAELLQLAQQGKVPGVEYAAHTALIDEVEADWGEPDTKESAGKGIYATYSKKHVVFGFNKGSKIFDVRSSAADLQKLTLKQIEAVLGTPDRTTVNGSDKIYIYQAGKRYDLKFIIPEASGKVDHISVFSEQDSINNMAG
ncbi:YjgB family protein [Paenibacillus sp. sgz5001063]|uniref:YjgB family protein n=1 Tax=Paenibacillus sp. sgz5001063 TaxID=3242474 RepID=UPI0036D22317